MRIGEKGRWVRETQLGRNVFIYCSWDVLMLAIAIRLIFLVLD